MLNYQRVYHVESLYWIIYWMVQSPFRWTFYVVVPLSCFAVAVKESEAGDDSWLGIWGCLETGPKIDMCEVFWGKQWFRVFQFELNGILEILEPKSQGSMLCVEIGSPPKWPSARRTAEWHIGCSPHLPIFRKPRIPPPCVAGAPGWNCVDVAGDVTGMMLNIHISIYAYIIWYTYWYIYIYVKICEDVWI